MDLSIEAPKTLREAMFQINEKGVGLVFVTKNGRLVGALSDGDIRRAILSGKSLETKAEQVMNKNLLKIQSSWPKEKVEEFLGSRQVVSKIPYFKALLIPVVDDGDRILKIVPVTRDKTKNKDVEIKDVRKLRKVLVIGGAGYIGSIFVRDHLSRGYDVKVMDNLTYTDEGIKDLISKKAIQFLKGDILDISAVVEAMNDVDAVVHLAAVVGDPSSKLKPKETIEINYLATKMIAETCKYLGIPRLIFASTCSVYGFNEELVNEESPLNPLSLYAETKMKSENAILESADELFHPTVLRLSTVYGYSPRMRFDLVVNLFIAKALFEKEITVYGRGLQKRPFIHIEDVSTALVKVLEAPLNKVGGRVFNVGSGDQNLSVKELATIINKKIPDARIVYIKEKEDDRSYNVNFDRVRSLGFEARNRIDEAITNISTAINSGKVKSYKDAKYSNYKFLKEALQPPVVDVEMRPHAFHSQFARDFFTFIVPDVGAEYYFIWRDFEPAFHKLE